MRLFKSHRLPTACWIATACAFGPAAHAESIVTGKVEAQGACSEAPMEAWLSVGSILLYQVEVPQHGTFEFHVNSGKYNLVVIGATGCLAETEIEARENETRTITLAPKQALKPPAPAKDPATPAANAEEKHENWTDWLIPSAHAWGYATDCPTCNNPNGWYAAPQVSFMQSQMPPPWYTPFGAMTYPDNFYYPAPWINSAPSYNMGPMPGNYPQGGVFYNGGINSNPGFNPNPGFNYNPGFINNGFSSGVNGSMFPSQGPVFAAKPVLYVNGPNGAAIKIRTHLSDTTHWLVAVPEHGEKAWSGTIQDNQFKTADASYRYIFYDYRSDHKTFQDDRGFCVKRGELIPKLSAALKASGFKSSQIEDFRSYWSLKIPPSERYCVYPQTTEELKPNARLVIEPKPSVFSQLLFVVQMGENLDGKGKFRRAPVATWQPSNPPAPREPAAQDGTRIEVREWGIGFLEGKK